MHADHSTALKSKGELRGESWENRTIQCKRKESFLPGAVIAYLSFEDRTPALFLFIRLQADVWENATQTAPRKKAGNSEELKSSSSRIVKQNMCNA